MVQNEQGPKVQILFVLFDWLMQKHNISIFYFFHRFQQNITDTVFAKCNK